MPEHDSDYDGAWKEALREHLPHFIEKYFPAVHAAIDWTAPLEWLDKEVSQVLGQAHRRKLWGSLPGGVEERIRKLTLERLQALGEAVLEFKSLQDLESWLDSNEKPEAGEPD